MDPTPEMMVEHLDEQVQTLLRENELLRNGIREAIDELDEYRELSAYATLKDLLINSHT